MAARPFPFEFSTVNSARDPGFCKIEIVDEFFGFDDENSSEKFQSKGL